MNSLRDRMYVQLAENLKASQLERVPYHLLGIEAGIWLVIKPGKTYIDVPVWSGLELLDTNVRTVAGKMYSMRSHYD